MVEGTEIVFALGIALTISIIISIALRREGPRRGFLLLFITIFLITLAGGLWLSPAGPYSRGIYWLPFLVVGALGSYILYLRAPRKPPHSREETIKTLDRIAESKQLERLTYLTFDLFFWIILVFLLAVVLLHYLRKI
jgi:Ca2+/Na+ antiporter